MEERKVMNLEKTAVFRERVAQMKAGTAEIFQAAAVGSGAEERPSYGQIMGKSWENGENLGEILGRTLGYNQSVSMDLEVRST